MIYLTDLIGDDKVLHFDLNDCIMDNLAYLCWFFGLDPSDFGEWDTPLGHKVGMSDEDFLTLAYQTPSTQLAADPHPGVAEKFRQLRDAGYTIKIVTASCMSASQIVSWMDKHDIPFDGIIKTKTKLSKKVLFEDNRKTAEDRIKRRLPTVIFNQLWNDTVAGPRMHGWSDLQI